MGDAKAMSYSPFAAHTGLELENWGNGEATVSLPWHHEMTNLNGTAHGGAMFTLADVAMGLAALSRCPDGYTSYTRDANIRYVRRAEHGPLLCTAKVIEQDERGVVLSANVLAGGEVVCEVTGSCAYKKTSAKVRGEMLPTGEKAP